MSTLSFSSESVVEALPVLVGPPTQESMYTKNYGAECIDENTEIKKAGIGGVIAKFGSLSSVIRFLGVAAVVVSMCLFLLDGMAVVNDTQRFFTMLMLTGVLSAGGFALAFLLKEQRGARAFFGLSLLSVPVNFTVLGALVYSVMQFDQVSIAYPTVAHWEILDVASLGSAVVMSVLALVPLTILGISIMAKEGRSWLTASLLASSSLLLLPVRDTTWMAPIVAGMVIVLIVLITRFGENTLSLKTHAGRYVQALLFLPPAIMLFRSFWLYDVSMLSALVIAVTIFVGLRYASCRINPVGVIVNALHVLSAIVALICALISIVVVVPSPSAGLIIIVFSLAFGSLMLDIESRVQNTNVRNVLGVGASVVLATAVMLHQVFYDGFAVVLAGLIVSAALVLIGFIQKRKGRVLIGGLTFLGVLLFKAAAIITFFTNTGWLGFATLGAFAIVVASMLERFGPTFSMLAHRKFERP